jgi:hypothetical protein
VNLNVKLKGNCPEENQGGKNRLGSALHKRKEEIKKDEVLKESYLEKFTCKVTQPKCNC